MLWFKIVKYRAVHGILLLATSVLLVKFLAVQAIDLGRSPDYQPDQPIKFSHLVHAGANKIECLYCHYSAEYSKSAGIPSSNVCLNCHMIVREGSRSGKFEINKIFAHVDSLKNPVEWIRIHNLPDFVFFSHAQHVGAGKLDCAECHGPVEEMNVVYQYADLSMGWCLDCHRSRGVQFIENDYYAETYKKLHEQIVQGQIDSVLVKDVGGTDCMKCHY